MSVLVKNSYVIHLYYENLFSNKSFLDENDIEANKCLNNKAFAFEICRIICALCVGYVARLAILIIRLNEKKEANIGSPHLFQTFKPLNN